MFFPHNNIIKQLTFNANIGHNHPKVRTMQAIQMTMKLPVTVKLSGKWHIACCPILDVMAQGDTESKAKNNLADALYLFLTSCIERGTLNTVLKEICRA